MSTIDPNNGIGGSSSISDPTPLSDVPITDPDTSGSSASNSDPVDSLSTSSASTQASFFSLSPSAPVLTAPQAMSLLQYANSVSTARSDLSNQTVTSEERGFLVNKDVWGNAIATAQSIRDRYNSIRQVQHTQSNLAQNQQQQSDTMTPLIDAYNIQNDFTGDQAATDAMNQAITDFNNGTITDVDFNTAVNTYNSYAATHNTQPYVTDYNAEVIIYNQQVDDDNATITQTNIERATLGLDPLPLETPLPTGILPTQSLAPPAVVPVPALPVLPTTIPPVDPVIVDESLDSFLDQTNFKEYVEDLLHGLRATGAKINLAYSFRDLNMFIHRDILNIKNPTYDPDSYIQNNEKGTGPSVSGEGAASGSGYAQLAAGTSGSTLPRILGKNLFYAAAKASQAPTYLADVLALANVSIGQTVGLLSAAPGALGIGQNSLDVSRQEGSVVSVLMALGYANVVRGVVTSQGIKEYLGDLIAGNGLGTENASKLTKAITAGFQLSLIQQAIFQVANALGLPGSVAQILGNLNGIPNAETILGSAANPNVNDVLGNAHLSQYLKNNLVSQSGLNSEVIEASLKATIAKGEFESTYAFSNALQEELINQGVQEDEAIAASVQAGQLVDSEISSDYLDESVTSDQISEGIQQSDRVTQEAIAASVNQYNLIKDGQTAREIRDNVIEQLTLQGYAFKDALAAADKLAAVITGSELAKEISAEQYNQSLLQSSLAENIARHGGSSGLAGTVASSLQGQYANTTAIREAIFSQLTAAGITIADAHAIADQAVLIKKDADPFLTVGGSGIVSTDMIFERIKAEAYAALKSNFGGPGAMSLATQLAKAVVGPPSNQDIKYDDLNRPVSLLNLANDQIAALNEFGDRETLAAVTDSFRETMRPTDNLFYIVNKQNTPGEDLINAMSLMNSGHSKKPTNYLSSIDIAA